MKLKKSQLSLTLLLIVTVIIAGYIVPGPIRESEPPKTVAGYIVPGPIRESEPPKTVAGYIVPGPIRESLPITIAV